MIPGKYNIVCPQGSTYEQEFIYSINDVVVNLTGYTARMQVREKYTSTSAILSLTTENGRIVIVGSLGKITVNIPSATTAGITAKDYIYDLELVSSSNKVTRLFEGKFMVTPEVTR
jgi:hypothetical protein